MKRRAIMIIPAENALLKRIKSHYPQFKRGFDCVQSFAPSTRNKHRAREKATPSIIVLFSIRISMRAI